MGQRFPRTHIGDEMTEIRTTTHHTASTFAQRSAPSRRTFLHTGSLAAALAWTPRNLLAFAQSAEAPVVATSLGSLRGEALPDGVRVFRGVPFARPPVGPLRFRPPLPPEPWTGTRDALNFAPPATQPELAHSVEDCLYLNLWTPPSPGPHPVFVWIHGGGYTGGSASAPIFDGAAFAREGIVLVTVAYRLGVFGFMDLGPLLGPEFADSGNNALRDLTAALHWVHGNISAFGGDPARVTIGGESAGAKATAALMAIPEAASLFSSAISESGGGERVLTQTEAVDIARSFGAQWRHRHPPSSTSSTTFEDLLTAPAQALLATQQELIANSSLHFPFRPEINAEASGSLLAGRPVDLVARGSARGKRLLIGTNRDESALFLGPHPAHDPTSRDLGNLPLPRFNSVFSRYTPLHPRWTEAERRIRAVTAEEYWVPSIRLADAHTSAGGAAWMYRLDFAEPAGSMAGEAFHSLDLGLVWEKLDPAELADPKAVGLAHSIHTAWCTFIRGEAPSAPHLPPWPPYNRTERSTMILTTASHIEQRPFEPELRLWDGVL